MESFLIRLLITIGIIWLTQTIIQTFEITPPASKIILVLTIILSVIWLLTGGISF